MSDQINKLDNKMMLEFNRPQKKYRVTLEDVETGEVLYRWLSYGGLGCSVEQVRSFGAEIEGQHQIFAWGHPMIQWYGLDQQQKWFQAHGANFVDVLEKCGIVQGGGDFLKEMFSKTK